MVCVVAMVIYGVLLCVGGDGRMTAPVMTTSGPIVGEVLTYSGTPVHRYLGVPYAAPPLGELRFAPPQPPQPWNQTRYTTRYGNRCMTYKVIDPYYYPDTGKNPPPMAEDCLYLNLVIPQTGGVKKAVMVHIHGGTLLYGDGGSYDLEALAIAGDVVHVAMNYRLNVFGFLATMDDSAPGNAGMLDQVLALRWVQENIASFGGDPDRVTIFGISAGGWSVSAHLVSPLSRGLFHRAICQSGTLYGVDQPSREEAARKARGYRNKLGCAPGDEAATLACLRQATAEELLDKAFPDNLIVMTHGNPFLPSSITEMYDTRQVHPGVAVIAGMVSEEGANSLFTFNQTLFGSYSPELLKTGFPCSHPLLGPRMLEDSVGVIRANYSSFPLRMKVLLEIVVRNEYLTNCSDLISNIRAAIDLRSDALFTTPTVQTVHKVREAGNQAFLYYFDQTPASILPTNIQQLNDVAAPELHYGAIHGMDMYYMFGYGLLEEVPMSVAHVLHEQDKALSRSMLHCWTTFAKTGKVEFLSALDNIIDWPEFDSDRELYLIWKHPMGEASISRKLRKRRCEFWDWMMPLILDSMAKLPSETRSSAVHYRNAKSNEARTTQTRTLSCIIPLIFIFIIR